MTKLLVVGLAIWGVISGLGTKWPILHAVAFHVDTFAVSYLTIICGCVILLGMKLSSD